MLATRVAPGLILWVAIAITLTGCQDTAQSPPARPESPIQEGADESTLGPLDLVYVCGNKFLATNATRAPVQVEYRVAGTNETGGLTLDQGPGGGSWLQRNRAGNSSGWTCRALL